MIRPKITPNESNFERLKILQRGNRQFRVICVIFGGQCTLQSFFLLCNFLRKKIVPFSFLKKVKKIMSYLDGHLAQLFHTEKKQIQRCEHEDRQNPTAEAGIIPPQIRLLQFLFPKQHIMQLVTVVWAKILRIMCCSYLKS